MKKMFNEDAIVLSYANVWNISKAKRFALLIFQLYRDKIKII